MKWAVLLLALLGLGTAAGLLLQDDNGYVLMAWHGWTVETSLIFFVILLGAVLLLQCSPGASDSAFLTSAFSAKG